MILKILGLKNDLRDLTRKIEEAIHNLHAQQREGLGFSDGHKDLSELSELDAPFAKIGTVSEGSPADKAGLKCDDLVLRFGSVRASNYGSLQDLAGVVQHRINCEIPVYVRRGERNLAITLIPRTWSGRGVIGCTFLPQDNVDRWIGLHGLCLHFCILFAYWNGTEKHFKMFRAPISCIIFVLQVFWSTRNEWGSGISFQNKCSCSITLIGLA